jgi:carbon storage regulator
MLILTRRKGEVITIGDDVELYVMEILPDRVKIGIKAPDNVAVHRKEVADQLAAKLIDGTDRK